MEIGKTMIFHKGNPLQKIEMLLFPSNITTHVQNLIFKYLLLYDKIEKGLD